MQQSRVWFLAAALSVLLVACGGREFRPEQMQASPVEQLGEQVTMRLPQEELEQLPEELNLVITNHTPTEYTYGEGYVLEVLLEENWYVVDPDEEIAFNAIATLLPPDAINSELVQPGSFYSQLPPGRYRLVKQFCSVSGNSYAAAEFTLK